MRIIVLSDIDQTLLYSGAAGMTGMRRAFRDLYGVGDSFGRVEFSGRTDSAIFADEARLNGFDAARIASELPRFIDAYIPHLETALHEATGGTLKPGVAGVLAALDEREDVLQGLGTGNFRRACESKLRHFEVDAYFPGFGEDSEDRHEVIAAGIERLRNGDSASRIVIIGDTPNDVSAARANGGLRLRRGHRQPQRRGSPRVRRRCGARRSLRCRSRHRDHRGRFLKRPGFDGQASGRRCQRR